MSGSPRMVGVVLGIAALAGGGYWFLRTREADPEVPVVKVPATAAPQQAPQPADPVVAPLPTPESAGVPEVDCITYPDGTKLPPLNGVKKAPAMVFHRMIEFTKVVGIVREHGLDWYLHQNGARSTTRFQLRNGVQEAVSDVSMPAPVKPMVDDK